MNIFQKAITPDMPRVLEGEQIYVYVPQATSTNAGIASYKNEDFKVNDGVVSLRWPAKSFTQGPLANPSLIKVQEDEFEYTNTEVNLDYEGSRLTSSTVDVQLKRDLRDAYDRPDLVMLDSNYFPRTIVEKDGKQYYKYNTTAVHYIVQALTDAQKRQARENIDAGSNQDIKSVNDRVTQAIININNRVDEILTLKVTSVNGKSGDVILKNSDLENDTNYSTIDFVNSSIATNTATFRGTYNSLSDLLAYAGDKDDNDYAFVIEIDSVGNTLYNRYKYNGTEWLFEYSLNNSSFTQVQWTAINSGITDELTKQITINTNKLSGIEAGAQVNTVISVNSKTGSVVLTADDVNAVATSGGTIDGYLKIKGEAEERHLITRGIGGCSADTTTQDDLFINFGTEYGLKVGKTGQFGVDKDGNIITSGNIQGFTIYENDISLIDKYQQIGDYATNTALNKVEEVANYAKETADEALTQVVEGLGSKIYINEALAGTVNFTSDPQSQINTINSNKADTDYVDRQIAALVGAAPETLDTLEELAAAFKENADVVKTLEDAIVTKVAKTDVEDFLSATSTNPVQNKVITKALEEKIDKIVGKGLSTNDFTNDYKSQVENNTTARHTHNNKTLLDTYTQTETNIADAVAKKHIHNNKEILDRTTASYTTDNTISVEFAESERQKSKNLFDLRNLDSALTGYVTTTQTDQQITFTSTNPVAWFGYKIPVKIGNQYTISAKNLSYTTEGLFIGNSDGRDEFSYGKLTTDIKALTITANTDYLYIKGYASYSTVGSIFIIDELQLEEGSVETDYQPYNGAIVHEKELETREVLYNDSESININDSTLTTLAEYLSLFNLDKTKTYKVVIGATSNANFKALVGNLSNNLSYTICYIKYIGELEGGGSIYELLAYEPLSVVTVAKGYIYYGNPIMGAVWTGWTEF